MPNARVVVIQPGESEIDPRLAELARQLQLPVAPRESTDGADFGLALVDDRLTLINQRDPKSQVCVRFDRMPVRHGRIVVSRRDPLGRAFGRDVETIVDATAGFGKDAFMLACMGFDVTAVERSAVVAALVRDGIARGLDDGRIAAAVADRLRLIEGDAREVLPGIEPAPDAVYIDPMFPARRRKSALPPKEAQALRRLVGSDEDQLELVGAAMRCAGRRVVIKRPDDAPPLVPGPVASIVGKLVRYDVYHAPSAARPELEGGQVSGE